jgi:hypothetical protein
LATAERNTNITPPSARQFDRAKLVDKGQPVRGFAHTDHAGSVKPVTVGISVRRCVRAVSTGLEDAFARARTGG